MINIRPALLPLTKGLFLMFGNNIIINSQSGFIKFYIQSIGLFVKDKACISQHRLIRMCFIPLIAVDLTSINVEMTTSLLR